MGEHEDLPFRDDPDDPDKPEGDRGEHEKKRLFERAVPEILRRVVERAVESGASRLAEGPENLRNFVQEMKLPKEVLHYLYTQMDETKNGLYRVVAKEIRDVLEQTQFADELTKVLTRLSFEIKTEIRFIPNDAAKSSEREASEDDEAGQNGLPEPEVSTQVSGEGSHHGFAAPPAPPRGHVTTKKARTGGEIDSYCTKCRLDLTHRIIAMVGDVVKKVECKTCGSHHLYRKPKSERTPPGIRGPA